MSATLHLLCAGAAQGLVRAVEARFLEETGARIEGRFGAVGAMKEALLAGAPCDVMIVTDAMVAALADAGRLGAALLAASAIYFPDPQRATAGIHFDAVMQKLGVRDTLAARFRTFPNGATAMKELAAASPAGALGCTQITEILYTPGVALVGPLPPAFELATVYTAAVAAGSSRPALARRFIDTLAGPASRAQRTAGGFELD